MRAIGIQVLQIYREFQIPGPEMMASKGKNSPKGIISIVAHRNGRTGDLSVSFCEQSKDGVSQHSESITFLDPAFMKADEWDGLLIGLLSIISKRRFGDHFTLVEAALNEIPINLFLTEWNQLTK